ncbi:signal peptidase I [Natranaerofaba carboxydovora]|uniref:signal peptidase I n=1 Tax=Natranaerofaba carboxydovora TaxID=2742683 RepID=UPI001F12BD81|nr:signal peptidase I [Natranaerofaba carboxydovora]UMZ73339.1 Signal peptidase I T [Natranaerofaba carboxydovora]
MTKNIKKETLDWIKSLAVAVLIALLIRHFVVEIFLVEGQSMYPTLSHSERLVVNKFWYRLDEPERDDIVVFSYNENKDFIKRVIGLPGEEIKIDEGEVHLDGEPLEEDYYTSGSRNDNFGPEVVPENHYFVLGDNRDNSMDSRSESVGYVSQEQIKGKAFFVFWPFDSAGTID